jgi:hypothetical protein
LAKAKVYAKNYANNILITKVLLEQFCASWKIIKRGKIARIKNLAILLSSKK